ncbi:MAG: Potassium transporter TrkA [Promethearchaeota archaeon]|nr:MAG: Potassium transporter TrkA [Candidatus Lokiarchaeota archaeon]
MYLAMIILFIVIIVMLILFIWDYWRYDIVALMALFFIAVVGIINYDQVFLGFSHSAIITVVAILVVSSGLNNSGLTDLISKMLSKVSNNTFIQLFVILITVTILSAFINNIGALVLLMPLTTRLAKKNDKHPAIYLLPLAFGSQFGGWITLIATPPNLIISSFRERSGLGPFNMFDFTVVGIGISIVCILFIVTIGWRLIPQREVPNKKSALSQINEYLTEVRVTEESKIRGKRIYDISKSTSAEINIVTLIREGSKILAPSNLKTLREDDILIIKGHPRDIKTLINDTRLQLTEEREFKKEILGSEEVNVMEVVVGPNSILNRETVKSIDLFNTYGLNLLAVSHHEKNLYTRLKNIKLKVGDILMIQGRKDIIDLKISELGCLPLAEREIGFGKTSKLYIALAIFITAVIITALNILPPHIAFSIAALAMILSGVLSLQEAYKSINWPVIILLGALIPFGIALETTGGSEFITSILLESGIIINPIFALIIILLITTLLANIVNNVDVIIMTPIAITIATALQVSIDPFLIAVLIGASSPFFTPIGHHSNILVMGPSGLKFGDYWRLGIFIEIIIIFVGVPLILLFFPF